MERDLVRVREFYAGWKTEDLRRIVTVDKADYEPWAINIIEGIPIGRITPEKIEMFRSDSKMDESGFHGKNGRMSCNQLQAA